MRILLLALISTFWLFWMLPATADTIPQFEASRHVYIDPALADRLSVSPTKLEADLTSRLNFPGTNYYLVGLKTDSTTRQIGVDAANSIVKAWQFNPTLPLRNRVLVVWALSAIDGHNGIGVNASPDVSLDRNSLNIKQILQTYMPLYPGDALLATVTSINRSLSHDAFMSRLKPFMLMVIFSIVVFGIFGSWWPHQEPVGSTDEVSAPPVSPRTEWPAQSPVYVADNLNLSSKQAPLRRHGLTQQPSRGSTRISHSSRFRSDDWIDTSDSPSFGSDD